MQQDYMPMNAAALMDRVFDLYRLTIKTQIAFSLIIGIISIILMLVFGFALTFGVVIVMGIAETVNDNHILIAILLVFIGILPLYAAWAFLSSSGHILISKQAFYGEPVELPFRDTLKAFFRVMTSALAQLILMLPWMIVLFFLVYSAIAGYNDVFQFILDIHPVVIVASGFAYAIFFVIYSNIFALAIPVAIFEKRYFFATISRSLKLLKDDFWRILGLRILWTILVFLFSYSAQGFIVALVGVLTVLAGNVVDFGTLWVATSALQFYALMFVSILIAPMEGIMTALIYFNQKIKKEGLDITIGLDRLRRGYTS